MCGRPPMRHTDHVPYSPDMRASDGDRDKIASRLRDAHTDGRLSAEEFQLRLDALYDATTYGEIEPLVRDLPVARSASTAPVPKAATGSGSTVVPRTAGDKAMRALWTLWACLVSVNVVIWVLASIGNAEFIYFWPIWVAGPAGAVLASISVARRVARD